MLANAPMALEFPIELSITRLHVNHPVFTAYIRDITERRQIEQNRSLQMKDDFIANVSHQLRTPIFSIRGFLELLLKGKVKEEAVQQEFLGRAYDESSRLMLLVDNLLICRSWKAAFAFRNERVGVEFSYRRRVKVIATVGG
ncbi:MAG: hypothetical protein IPL78_29230 [Chloroflexi bacterium]|nr:hypothetical protein [Chloroflexota bacterium]